VPLNPWWEEASGRASFVLREATTCDGGHGCRCPVEGEIAGERRQCRWVAPLHWTHAASFSLGGLAPKRAPYEWSVQVEDAGTELSLTAPARLLWRHGIQLAKANHTSPLLCTLTITVTTEPGPSVLLRPSSCPTTRLIWSC